MEYGIIRRNKLENCPRDGARNKRVIKVIRQLVSEGKRRRVAIVCKASKAKISRWSVTDHIYFLDV